MKTKINNRKSSASKNSCRVKTELNDLHNAAFIENCARLLAYDLIRYSRNDGDMTNLTATNVYKFLHELGEKGKV